MTDINLISIYISNFAGILLTVITLLCNRWRISTKSKQNSLIMVIAISILISCVADPIIFFSDGKQGVFYTVAVYIGNSWLYIANIISNYCWIILLHDYLDTKLTSFHFRFYVGISILGGIILVLNIFFPLVFTVDSANHYSRQPFYYFFICICALFAADSLISYYSIRKQGGMLKFFPILLCFVPAFLGVFLQSICYGVSLIWPFAAISLAGVVFSMQNDMIFRDKLTGLYNRYYFELIKQNVEKYKSEKYTALMLDLNNFKHINDEFGHLEGDSAIVDASNILRDVTGTLGIVIRYAGDEFVVILNSVDETVTQEYIKKLNSEFELYNKNYTKPYILSVSLGGCVVDLSIDTVDEIIRKADKLMYENKTSYYEEHKEFTRR